MTDHNFAPIESSIPEDQTIAEYRAARRTPPTGPRYPGSILAEALLFVATHPVRHPNR